MSGFADDKSGFLSGGYAVADFGFEGGVEEFSVRLVERDYVVPLFVGAGSGEDGTLPLEVIFGEDGWVKGESLEGFAVVVVEGDGGGGSDGEGEAVVRFAPGAELLDEAG